MITGMVLFWVLDHRFGEGDISADEYYERRAIITGREEASTALPTVMRAP